MKRVLLCTLLLVCLLSVTTSYTFADGKYFPAKAYRTSPTIHSQRAILKYKDGVETLVIESSFDGEGKDFGWVIPLPSRPIKFEEASPGFLKTLSDTIQPKITHDLTGGLPILFGPNYLKFKEAVDLVDEKGAFSIQNNIELKEALNLLLSNKNELKKASETSKNYVGKNVGSTKLIMKKVFNT